MHQKKMDYESLKDKYDLLSTQKMGHQSES